LSPDKYIKNYIDGSLVPALSGAYLDNINPAIGQVYSHIPDSNADDVQRAYEAAERAFPIWSKIGLKKRFRILARLADIIEQNLDDFATAESVDSGKPFKNSVSIDIPRAHQNIRFFATAILHFSSESHHMEGEAINFTLRHPIGVVGCI
jgi:aminomuconate-semialdehyde/2-hydroxymuconate-6-semialdehyde dehydrogenase